MQDIWDAVVEWTREGRKFALARVIKTWGSAPRSAGAAMIVGEDMEVAGSVSGGCIEGAVIEEAQRVLESGEARQLSYGVDDEKAWSVGLSCGGEVQVLVEKHLAFAEEKARSIWRALEQAVEGNQPAILLTRLQPAAEAHLLVYPDGGVVGDWGAQREKAVEVALESYAGRKNQVAELGEEAVFVQVFPRRDQLLIIGAGHITIPLVQFANPLGFETSVIDPRRVFASIERFAVAPHQLFSEWPGEVLSGLDLTDDSYAVLLTHDPKIDDEALHVLLQTPVAYIGALGSRKTHAKRVERLREAGFSTAEIERIKGPAGLDIRAKTPAEIALSIMAEIVAAKRSH